MCFASQLFSGKDIGFIHENKCTVGHFGDLLLKEFGDKCSFKNGGALYDGKDTIDIELRNDIQSEFGVIKQNCQ